MRYLLFLALLIPIFSTIRGWAQENDNSDKEGKKILKTPISLQVDNQSLVEILDTLHQSYQLNFSYIHSELPQALRRRVDVQEENLEKVLDEILVDTGIKYFVVHTQIVLVKRRDLDYILDSEPEEEVIINDSIPVFSVFYLEEEVERISVKEVLKNLLKLFRYDDEFYTLRDSTKTDTLRYDSTYYAKPDSSELHRLSVHRIRKLKKYYKVKVPARLGYAWRLQPGLNYWPLTHTEGVREPERIRDNPDLPSVFLRSASVLSLFWPRYYLDFSAQYHYFNRSGEHRQYFFNTIYPETIRSRSALYSENFHSLGAKLTTGIKTNVKKMKVMAYLGLSVEYILKGPPEEPHRIYEDQFFSNINANSITNANLSPYFNQNFEAIARVPKKSRTWYPSVVAGMLFSKHLGKNWHLETGPEWNIYPYSLFLEPSPVGLRLGQLGITMGVSHHL